MQSISAASPESALLAIARRHLRFQRFALILLIPTSIACLTAVGVEKFRADRTQSDLTAIVNSLKSSTPDLFQPSTSAATATTYYPATLIADDDSETPLVGKALRVKLGDSKTVEIWLHKNDRGFLFMWAPAKREDDYFNRVVLNPSCANAYALNLERVDLRKGNDTSTSDKDIFDAVTYAPPR